MHISFPITNNKEKYLLKNKEKRGYLWKHRTLTKSIKLAVCNVYREKLATQSDNMRLIRITDKGLNSKKNKKPFPQ